MIHFIEKKHIRWPMGTPTNAVSRGRVKQPLHPPPPNHPKSSLNKKMYK